MRFQRRIALASGISESVSAVAFAMTWLMVSFLPVRRRNSSM
jgi:hypothetical protein